MIQIKTTTMPVTGLTCTNCATAISENVGKLPGVTQAYVDFASERLSVSFDSAQVSEKDIIATVQLMGYGVATGKIDFLVTGLQENNDALSFEKKEQTEDLIIANHLLQEEINQRKLAEKALQASEQEFRSLAESMPQIVWITRADGWNIYFNQQWVVYTGLTLVESYGHGWNKPFHPDDQQRAWDAWQNAVNNNGIYSIEARLRRFDGVYRWWLVRGVPQLSDSGVILKWFGTCTDIEEIKQAEEATRRSEEYFRNVFEHAAVGKSITGIDGSIKTNKAFCEILGYSCEELSGLNWRAITHPDDIESNIRINESILAGNHSSVRWEKRYLHKDGHIVWADVSTVLQRDKDKKPLYFITTIQDITERKLAEEKLKESHNLIRIAGELAKLGGWYVNLQENRSYWSDEVAAIHEMPAGYSPLVEEGISLYAPEWRDRITRVFTDCAQKGIPYNEEMEIITSSGKRVWIQTLGEAVKDENGIITKVQGAFQDISERKKAEETLRETNEYLENLFNSANAPIIVWDPSLKITRFNKAFEKLSGYEATEVIGKNVDILFPENKVKLYLELTVNTSIGARWETVEIEILRKDGEVRVVLWNSANILDNTQTKITATIAQGNDITERKQAEIKLHVEKERLRTILDMVGDPIFLKGNDHRITNANRAFYEIFGMDEDSVIGYTLAEAVPENERQQFLQVDRNVLDTGITDIREEELTVANQTHTIVTRKSRFIDDTGEKFLVGSIHDITKRKQAEESVLQEKKFNQVAIDSLPGLFYLFDEQGHFLRWNKNYEEVSGYSAEEIAVMSPLDYFTEPDKSNIETAIQQVWTTGNAVTEGKFTSKNRTQKQYFFTGQLFWFEGKRCLVGMGIDITERKNTEKALSESEEKFRRLFKNTPLPVCYVNALGEIVLRNERFLKVFGYTETEVPSLNEWWIKAYPDEEYRKWVVPNWEAAVKNAAENGTDIESETYHVTCKDGEVREIIISGTVVNDNFLATFIDITERIQAEEALSRYTERLQNLHRIDQIILQAIESPEAIVQNALQHIRGLLRCQRASVGIFDFENKEVRVFAADVDGKTIVQVGISMDEEMYGVVDILRKNRIEIVEDMSKAASSSLINKVLQAEGIQASINVALISAQAMYGVLNIGWEASRYINQEESDIVSEVAGQITIAIEQAHLLKKTKNYAVELEQRVIQRTEQLELANKELEAFSYSVSHDLRAPLRHISGFISLFLENKTSQLTAEEREYLDVVVHSTEEMGKLIDALLSFSRLNRSELVKAHIKTSEIINRVLKLFKQEIQSRLILINIGMLPYSIADPQLIYQVWTNLISNAIKYTAKKENAIIEIGGYCETYENIFFIKDNGAGFNMKYADKLFTVFQRLHKPRDFEGIGIGLANVHRIVSRHGGRCWAEGEINAGATFYFSLPD